VIKAGKVKTLVDEVAKFNKGEIEFLFEILKNTQIPGSNLGVAMSVMTKLKSQHQLLNRLEKEQMAKVQVNIRKNAIDKAKKEIEESQKLREDKDGELWVEDE
tara:strand:+ start:1059 stop:1367 length:309 start_codon:yes stop_codon:yes gene_type:complete